MKLRRLKPREADISKLIKDQLELYYQQGKLRYFRAHPIRLVTRKGKTFPVPVEESQKGAADFFVFLPAEVWFIETKRPGAGLSDYQKAWSDWAIQLFYRYFKVDSVAEAYQVLDFLKSSLPFGRD